MIGPRGVFDFIPRDKKKESISRAMSLDMAIEEAAAEADLEDREKDLSPKPPEDTDGDLGKFVVSNLRHVPIELLKDHLRERLLDEESKESGSTEIDFAVGRH